MCYNYIYYIELKQNSNNYIANHMRYVTYVWIHNIYNINHYINNIY